MKIVICDNCKQEANPHYVKFTSYFKTERSKDESWVYTCEDDGMKSISAVLCEPCGKSFHREIQSLTSHFFPQPPKPPKKKSWLQRLYDWLD